MQDRELQAALSSLSEDEQTRYQFCARRNGCDSSVELGRSIVESVVDSLCESVGLLETPIQSKKARGGAR